MVEKPLIFNENTTLSELLRPPQPKMGHKETIASRGTKSAFLCLHMRTV